MMKLILVQCKNMRHGPGTKQGIFTGLFILRIFLSWEYNVSWCNVQQRDINGMIAIIKSYLGHTFWHLITRNEPQITELDQVKLTINTLNPPPGWCHLTRAQHPNTEQNLSKTTDDGTTHNYVVCSTVFTTTKLSHSSKNFLTPSTRDNSNIALCS